MHQTPKHLVGMCSDWLTVMKYYHNCISPYSFVCLLIIAIRFEWKIQPRKATTNSPHKFCTKATTNCSSQNTSNSRDLKTKIILPFSLKITMHKPLFTGRCIFNSNYPSKNTSKETPRKLNQVTRIPSLRNFYRSRRHLCLTFLQNTHS